MNIHEVQQQHQERYSKGGAIDRDNKAGGSSCFKSKTFFMKRYTGVSDDLTARRNDQEVIYWNEKVCVYMRERGYKDEVYLKGRY